ncbi:MAG: diguanylate cyclase [Xanthobacteraceae bacterium]
MTRALVRLFRFDRPSDAVYVELVDALFSLVPPLVILLISLGFAGATIYARTGDYLILGLTAIALVISAERILMVMRYRRANAPAPLSFSAAQSWEKQFAARSFTTTVIVGAMGGWCFMLPYPSIHMLIVGVLFAYGAGTVTRVAYRPRLAIVNLLITSAPSIAACLYIGGTVYWCLSFLMVIFLLGAFETVQHLYATIVSQLTLKLRFAGLARRDPLTGLSNRLALNENLEAIVAATSIEGRSLAIHSLDLDNFKQANDRFGHPVGDAILREVAKRLLRLTRQADLLVRLGGDEFMLVQTQIESREQTLALATRILKEIGSTYQINGNAIQLGTSVGIAIMTPDQPLTAEELLVRADQALYQAKRTGSGFAVHAIAPQLVPPLPGGGEIEDTRRTVNLN